MTCPNCGADSVFTWHSGYSTQDYGETHWEEWATCNECGAETDERELDRMFNQEVEA